MFSRSIEAARDRLRDAGLVLAMVSPDPSNGLVLYGGTGITETDPSVFLNGFSLHLDGEEEWIVRSDLRRGVHSFGSLDAAIQYILSVHVG